MHLILWIVPVFAFVYEPYELGLLLGKNLMRKFSYEELKIVTVDSHNKVILTKATEAIGDDELSVAQEVAEKLFLAINPLLPAAGLAAPQIGINKSVFIYSYDRDPKNLEVVINPLVLPVGEEKTERWEGCFSVILSKGTWKVAKVPRYQKIRVSYLTLQGKKVERELEGVAAQIFQHEYDHLMGVTNIERKDAKVKRFTSKEEMFAFLDKAKRVDF